MKFVIPVTWVMCGEYEVEADSLEEAKTLVNGADEPYNDLPKGDYVDDSMVIDNDLCLELNSDKNEIDT